MLAPTLCRKRTGACLLRRRSPRGRHFTDSSCTGWGGSSRAALTRLDCPCTQRAGSAAAGGSAELQAGGGGRGRALAGKGAQSIDEAAARTGAAAAGRRWLGWAARARAGGQRRNRRERRAAGWRRRTRASSGGQRGPIHRRGSCADRGGSSRAALARLGCPCSQRTAAALQAKCRGPGGAWGSAPAREGGVRTITSEATSSGRQQLLRDGPGARWAGVVC